MMRTILYVLLIFAGFTNVATAQTKTRTKADQDGSLDNAKVEVYKTIGEIELKMYIFNPEGHKESDRRPAIVFFFGGGWKNGSPKQFASQCEYLAKRGMVAMTAEYRVASTHNAKIIDCVADAKSAIRWARTHAQRLGIDSNKIAAGGGSAGGHLAACTGVVPGFEGPTDGTTVSSSPNAMVLFNPALVLANVDGEEPVSKEKLLELRERIGDENILVSPVHHVKPGLPPTIIFHGKADTTVPYRTVELFTDLMKKAGNRCELVGYENKAHGFFNAGREDNSGYQDTVAAMDKFLVSLGYLEPLASK
ncbi:MAG: alpha/beta hydrolase [Pirellulaceae bacterium]|nr:alpha/beta hydrolase [Pirellulaceae bacterium]